METERTKLPTFASLIAFYFGGVRVHVRHDLEGSRNQAKELHSQHEKIRWERQKTEAQYAEL
jgi:hypothetical protein